MTSKEVIKKVIESDNPPRIGYCFNALDYPSDILMCLSGQAKGKDLDWHDVSEIRHKYDCLKNFDGAVRHDEFGNLWARMSRDTSGKGEAIRGVLHDWEVLDTYEFPKFSDYERVKHCEKVVAENSDKFLVGVLPGFPFSIMRTMRNFDDFLMDVLLEQENVKSLCEIVENELAGLVENFAKVGMDAVMVYEDWGVQDRLLMSPTCFRELFLPSFERLAKKAHDSGVYIILHSCGYIYDILEDLIKAGIDVFQFDQPTLMDLETIAELFKKYNKTLFSPVDIQKILPTGNRQLIEQSAEQMIELFGKGGGLIAEDYMDYSTIMIKEEWAKWARDIFVSKGNLDQKLIY